MSKIQSCELNTILMTDERPDQGDLASSGIDIVNDDKGICNGHLSGL